MDKAQAKEMATQLFAQIDANKSGDLDKAEVRIFSQGCMDQVMDAQSKDRVPIDDAAFEESFKGMDKNGDGMVTFEELFANFCYMAGIE
jgi:Ca2+-binding EF-hand superfamily protein